MAGGADLSEGEDVSIAAWLAMEIIQAGLPLELSEEDLMLLSEREQMIISGAAVRNGYVASRDPQTGTVTAARPGTTP
jgi:hypothetical protein